MSLGKFSFQTFRSNSAEKEGDGERPEHDALPIGLLASDSRRPLRLRPHLPLLRPVQGQEDLHGRQFEARAEEEARKLRQRRGRIGRQRRGTIDLTYTIFNSAFIFEQKKCLAVKIPCN